MGVADDRAGRHRADSPRVHRVAAGVPDTELADYQRAVRTVLRHPLISEHYPDRAALPLVRRWSARAAGRPGRRRSGYRLELHGHPARLVRAIDDLDAAPPGRHAQRAAVRPAAATPTSRWCSPRSAGPASRSRCRELADTVAADAQPDRRAWGWTPAAAPTGGRSSTPSAGWRSAARCGSPTGRPGRGRTTRARGEALYDIDRDVVFALFRPTRVVQHLDSVAELLVRDTAVGRDSGAPRRGATRPARPGRARRWCYYAEVDEGVRQRPARPPASPRTSRG